MSAVPPTPAAPRAPHPFLILHGAHVSTAAESGRIPFEDAGRFDVELRFPRVSARLRRRPRVHGTVSAEGLASSAAATFEIRVSLPAIVYRLDFRADDGRGLTATFAHHLRLSSRSLTELSGTLASQADGVVLRHLRLRLDWRRLPSTLWPQVLQV